MVQAGLLVLSVGTPSRPALATIEPRPSVVDPLQPPAAPDPVALQKRQRWAACAAHADPCVRPRPARTLLLGLGILAGITSAGLLFGVGDRLIQADPSTLLFGIGGLATVGAMVGALGGRLGADGMALADRLRPATASLVYRYAGVQVLNEARPHQLTARVAPTLWLPHGHGRLRLLGHWGGWLTPAVDVDPRPQSSPEPVLRQRQLSIGVGLDLAVALPYPALPSQRSAHFGAAELRYRPEIQIRRDRYALGSPNATVIERTMLLPLTVGARWILSPRQRFTVMFGPRFDFVAFSDPGSTTLHRGSARTGPLYAEAWYDIDIPLTPKPRTGARHRTLDVSGQLTMGYIHSRFDGQGINIGPAIGFLGPIHVEWSTRLRPLGSPLAAQLGAFARLGNGISAGLELGIVAPDLYSRRRLGR